MFLKLMKHELRTVGRSVLPVLAGLLLMSGMARASLWLVQESDNTLVTVIGGIGILLFFLSCLAAVAGTAVLMVMHFTRSVHGDEAYLTHTLPVGVHSILISRLLTAYLAVLAALGTVYLCVRFFLAGVRGMQNLTPLFRELFEGLEEDPTRVGRTFLATMAVTLLLNVLRIAAAITVGHSFTNGKVAKSVVFYFLFSLAEQMVSAVVLVILIGLGEHASEEPLLFGSLTNSLLLSIGLNLTFGALYYLLTWLLTRRKLNLA